MIRAVLFDLGGTLHVCSTDEARKLWFARRLISRLSEYGIVLALSPEELSKTLQEKAPCGSCRRKTPGRTIISTVLA